MTPEQYFTGTIETRLVTALNPFLADRVVIHAIVAGLNGKLYPALKMLLEAQKEGKLEGVNTLVENSSGNMSLALAMLRHHFGIAHVLPIVPADIASGKLDPIRLMGVTDFKYSTEKEGEPSGIELARTLGEQDGYLNLGQYENENNAAAYEDWVGPRIMEKLAQPPGLLAVGLGTGGTIIGLSRYFKKCGNTHVVAVRVAKGAAVPGVRSEARLRDVKNDWKSASDTIMDIGTREPFVLSRGLWRDIGYPVGPSSGFALAGLLAFLEKARAQRVLDAYRDKEGVLHAAFFCHDSAYPYWDKYSTHLDPEQLT